MDRKRTHPPPRALALQPAGVLGVDVAPRAPDRAVRLEAAAKAQLPQAVAAPQARSVLHIGQNVPAQEYIHETLPVFQIRLSRTDQHVSIRATLAMVYMLANVECITPDYVSYTHNPDLPFP